MQGPEHAADLVTGWLTARIPAQLRAIEARLDLPARSLADPARVLGHDVGPIALEDWPSVYVLPQLTRELALVDVEADGGETYRVRYAIRVLAWVRADGYTATDALRKRYALAIREALLERKTLAPPERYAQGDPHAAAAVVPSTIREDYSDVFTDDAQRTIAGVVVDVDVLVLERTAAPTPLGTADTVDVDERHDTDLVPPHPAL